MVIADTWSIMSASFARLLTAREVAELLGMSESWVRKQTAAGVLPAVRLGDGPRPAVRYKISEIEAFVSGHQDPETTFSENGDRPAEN